MSAVPMLLVACAVAAAAAGQDVGQPKSLQPALLADVSGKLLNVLVEQPVDRTEPVRETILDVHVSGTGRTRGTVSVLLHPHADYALMELGFRGRTFSQTVGMEDPVITYSNSWIGVEINRTVAIDARGIHAFPSRACARAVVRLARMTNLGGEVESTAVDIGKRAFCILTPNMEAETSRKTECRVAPRFDKDTQLPLQEANKSLADATALLASMGLKPQLRWRTTADHLQARVILPPLAPTTNPPAIPSNADLAVRMHQGVLEEAAQVDLAGKTLSLLELGGIAEKILEPVLGTKKPATSAASLGQLLKSLGFEAPSVTFAPREPVSLRFLDQGFTITLHATGFKSGDKTYPARDIRAVYKIETTAEGFVAVRQGLPQVRTPGVLSNPEDAQDDNAARTFLELTFGLLFIERLDAGDLIVPLQSQPPLVLGLVRAETTHGWLQLGWTRKVTANQQEPPTK